MLSDEEKAIEELKNKKADYFMISNLTGKTLVNLIEKQSKEIEELKEKNENLLDALNNSIDIRKYWISKDKIKELREIDNIDLIQFKIRELLEERN